MAFFGGLFGKAAPIGIKTGTVAAIAVAASAAVLFLLGFLSDQDVEQLTGPLGKVAFVREGDIWVKNLPDGRERQLTSGAEASHPSWSPSGDWLAFSAAAAVGTAREYVIVGSDGSGRRTFLAYQYSWHPTQDRLVYVTEDSAIVVESAVGNARAVLVPPFASRSEGNRYERPQWSPDGEWIAYRQYRQGPTNTFPPEYEGS